MILVNLAKSYPAVARQLAELGYAEPKYVKVADLAPLAAATAGEWYRVSPLRIEEFGDLLVGGYAGEAVSVWKIAGHDQHPQNGTVTFQLKPALDWHQLVGAPQPTGPWKQGEARGIRYIPTEEYQRYQGRPNINTWKANTWSSAVAHHSRIDRTAIPVAALSTPAEISVSWPHLGPIKLAITSTGILEISVPHGLRTRTLHMPAPKPVRRRTATPRKSPGTRGKGTPKTSPDQ